MKFSCNIDKMERKIRELVLIILSRKKDIKFNKKRKKLETKVNQNNSSLSKLRKFKLHQKNSQGKR
jgi:hypothetical protein